jgi:hypothetical protein
MTHFEAYRWEDHVPRAGSWKFNLAAGLLALGLIYAAFPDTDGTATAAAAAAVPAIGVHDRTMSDGPAVRPAKSWWAYCPTAAADHADS